MNFYNIIHLSGSILPGHSPAFTHKHKLCIACDFLYFPPMKANTRAQPVPLPLLSRLHSMQVFCWGVRDMKYQLLPVNSPLVELECGGHVKCTNAIKNGKENPNFPNKVVVMDVVLCMKFEQHF